MRSRFVILLAAFSLTFTARAHAIFASGFEPPFNIPANAAEAARFLTQASFGPTPEDIARVQAIGYVGWLHQQFNTPPTRARPHLEQIAAAGVAVSHHHRMDRWFHTAVYAPDQLRQRMAYALSQILVISDRDSSLASDYFGVAEYWDLLATHAFGNYRDLMRAVSLSPQMARYLTFLRNRKGDPATGRLPDENYARELMQLFTIGLVERNEDFSPILDAQGRPIPTYDQQTIMELARVFTGFTYAGSTSFFSGSPNYLPMMCFQSQHDDQPKEIFGIRLLSGQCMQDLEEALDILFHHPNTPPFVVRQLIQRFVTSNPSPQYIERVVRVFKNNGQGVRGDLRAVLEAILLDPEARIRDPSPGYGKPREPLLKLTALWRAFAAQPPAASNGFVPMGVRSPQNDYAQRPLGAPTVFNFYEPDYRPAGPIADAGLYAPEFQIIDENYVIRTANHLYQRVWSGYVGMPNPPPDRPLLDLAPVAALANDPEGMVNLLDLRLTYGTMSPGLRDILRRMIAELPADGLTKARAAIQLITLSPDFAVQR